MSRIYQGGGADRRYQSSAQSRSYNPNKATSNANQIKQQGEAVLNDLKTLDRERQRQNQMDDLERSSSAKAADLDLRQEQIAESGQFKLDQMVEKNILAIDQLEDKQALKILQAHEKASFDLSQLGEKQSLQLSQQKDKGSIERSQLAERQSVERSQATDKRILDQQDREERFMLGMESRGINAQFAVDRAELQAQQAAQRANTQIMGTVINNLISFGSSVSSHIQQQNKIAETEAKQAQAEQDQRNALGVDWLYSDEGSAVSSTGEINPVVSQQRSVETSEQVVETAIQAQAGGNPIEAENIRQPLADATMDRNLRQQSVGEAAINFRPEFDGFIGDPASVVNIDGVPRTLASLKSRPELNEWLQGAARQLTASYGIDGKDSHAVVMTYGRAVKAAMAGAYSTLGPMVAGAAKSDRYEAGLGNAITMAQTDNPQGAWEAARNAYITSGSALGKGNKEINDNVFKDLLGRVSDPDSLLNVLKTGQAGTEFGNQREYAEMIQKEKTRRLQVDNNGFSAQQTYTTNQITTITQEGRAQLMATDDPEQSLAIRQGMISSLEALETPLAYEDINRLSEAGSTNNNARLSLLEAYESGNPPSTDELMDAYESGAITHEQFQEFKKMGLRSDQIIQAVAKTGLPPIKDQLADAVTLALARANVPATDRQAYVDRIVAHRLPHVKASVTELIRGTKDINSLEIQKGLLGIFKEETNAIYTTGNEENLLKREGQSNYWTYDLSNATPVAPVRINKQTGKPQRVYNQFDADKIPANASANDMYLTKDEFLKAVEVWDRGGSDYSNRIKTIADKLGYSPTAFVRRQAVALDYPAIEKVEAMQAPQASKMNYKVDPEVKEGLDVIGRYESDSVGSYDAVNQIGINGGHSVLPGSYSGDIKNMPQHGGKALVDMSIKEIMSLQAQTSQSNESWVAEGRLHAVGRYQFIGRTLASVVQATGIDVNEKFTPEIQDYLAGYLLSTASNGIGQWVGPSANASYAERERVSQARVRLQQAYRILRNPRATDVQIARAARTVGDPNYS